MSVHDRANMSNNHSQQSLVHNSPHSEVNA